MWKQVFATVFSLTVFLLLPPADLSRFEAWISVMYLYWTGRMIAWWAEGQLEQYRERRRARERREEIVERRRRSA